ncbi:nucleoside deaminase [Colwellia psychrerythraea]|uniref:CMP/dCMP deaminase zinc-binding protein n=1 Tax=Colwellia psychrerythraea TaxID=28229 RepID=A0A099L5I3_COLPS|nr:nucleoside deaminase [Colwellia psychrerythraea]KGJ97442.1 CMP/dCMP deaminase zinc-binding protein [Colwellia psychrerythraea]
MKTLFDKHTNKSATVLNTIAHMPTHSLPVLLDSDFTLGLTDSDFMRIAVLLAQKSYDEGGCPIGAVIIDNKTRKIVGKGHNTLIQEDHPYNHGETSAMRDAGRIDFSRTSLFTSLSPCDVCATLLYMRGVSRVVVGDVTNASGNEALLRDKGIQVDILEDQQGISLYSNFRQEKPDQDIEDWQGVSALSNHNSSLKSDSLESDQA